MVSTDTVSKHGPLPPHRRDCQGPARQDDLVKALTQKFGRLSGIRFVKGRRGFENRRIIDGESAVQEPTHEGPPALHQHASKSVAW
jgi:hypothetical protein